MSWSGALFLLSMAGLVVMFVAVRESDKRGEEVARPGLLEECDNMEALYVAGLMAFGGFGFAALLMHFLKV